MNSIGKNISIKYFESGHYFLDIQYEWIVKGSITARLVGFVSAGVIVGRVCVGQVHHMEGFDWVGFILRRICLRLVYRVCRDEVVAGLGLSRGGFV